MRKRLQEHGEPYRQGASKKLADGGRAAIAAGAAVLAARGRSSRPAAMLAGALMSGGALSARWSVFLAGSQSAADPKYVIGPQRDRILSGERAGASRTASRTSVPDPATGSPATLHVSRSGG